jgi:hypothetical protein
LRRLAVSARLAAGISDPTAASEEAAMASNIHVEAARIPDRDRLLSALEGHGLQPRAVNEVGIEVPCGDGDDGRACDELYGYVEDVVMNLGAPFVPVKHEGVIYLRPPTD